MGFSFSFWPRVTSVLAQTLHIYYRLNEHEEVNQIHQFDKSSRYPFVSYWTMKMQYSLFLKQYLRNTLG